MFSVLNSTFPFNHSLCLVTDPATNSFAFVCHYLARLMEESNRVLFVSFRDVLDSYKSALKRQNPNWQKVSFYLNTLAFSELIDDFDAVVIDGVPNIDKNLISLIEKALGKRFLGGVDSSEDVLKQFRARRCNSFIQIHSLNTGLSSEYDGFLSSMNGEEHLFKFGDQSLALSRKIK